MSNKFPNLLTSLDIGNIKIKNRFCAAPMAMPHMLDDGVINDTGISYYLEKAKGGFGLIIVGASETDEEIDPVGLMVGLLRNPDEYRKRAVSLVERVHPYGAKLFAQITMGSGRNAPGSHAPSEIPSLFEPVMNAPALTNEQIKRKIELMVQAALLVKASGYDGVEIHAMHWGCLLDQFAMSFTNKRTDEYGGVLENRVRVAKEIVEGIKQMCGPSFPVSMRFGMKSYISGFNKASLTGENEVGRTLEESLKIVKLLESFGYDVVNIDAGTCDSFYYATPPMYMPRGIMLELSGALKNVVSIPVLTGGGRLDDPFLCEQAIADGKMDAVVYGRASLADPYFPQKVEMGRLEKIRPCLCCNQGCIGRALLGNDASCAVNPVAAREYTFGYSKALQSKKIVVVGGGVAGMEAARTATLRGHSVSLYEKTDKLGGHLITGGQHTFKVEVHALNRWYQNELGALGVQVHTNSCINAEAIKKMDIDVAILAVGSKPIVPSIPGIDSAKAVSCIDALMGVKTVGKRVVVVGGGLVGCELSLDLAQKGKEVSIVEYLDAILSAGESVPLMNYQMLTDLLAHHNVKIYVSHNIEEINENGAVIVSKDGQKAELKADSVIIATGFEPVKSMADELYGEGIEIYQVGDGRRVGNIMRAIWDAYEIARGI